MGKIFFIIQILITSFVYASGRPQKDALNYYYEQLRVVNLSDTAIDFYYNNLNLRNTHLESGEEEITYKTPITNEFPGFIAIDRGNGDLEIYTSHYISEVRVSFDYILIVYNQKIDFYRVYDITQDYENLFNGINHNFAWNKLELQETNITIEIQNMTGVPIKIDSNGYLFGKKEQTKIIGNGTIESILISINTVILENDAKFLYTINDNIFSLKYIYFEIIYPKTIYEQIGNSINWISPIEKININNDKHKNITIILNGYDSGYEIKYE